MSPGAAGRLADFESFVAEQMSQLLGYAHALTGDRRHAEDLVQEALIRTGLAWHRVRRKDRPTAYVKTAILRLYLNERRRSSVPAAGYEVDNGAPDPGFTQVDEQDALKQALAKVPPKMRGARAALSRRATRRRDRHGARLFPRHGTDPGGTWVGEASLRLPGWSDPA